MADWAANPAHMEGAAPAEILAETAQHSELTRLVREYSRYIHGVAFSALRDHHDAEDVTQETFLRVMRQREPIENITNQRAWLAKIAWNLSLDKIQSRRAKLHVSIDDEDASATVVQLAARGTPADELAANKQMQGLLGKMIESLPEELRHTLQLSVSEGMTSAVAAEVLGIPEGTVRVRMMRARNLLKEKLAAVMEVRH